MRKLIKNSFGAKAVASCAVAVAFLLAGPADSSANTHERDKVSPWTEKGQVVGIIVDLTLRPGNYTKVRVGLGDASRQSLTDMRSNEQGWRNAAAGVEGNYIAYSFGEISGVTARTPKSLKLKVRYADAPNLVPGKPVEVVTAWRKQNYWHIHGAKTPMFRSATTLHTLPKPGRGNRIQKIVSKKVPIKTPPIIRPGKTPKDRAKAAKRAAKAKQARRSRRRGRR